MNHKNASDPLRILMIGPLPPPIGGATVVFQTLVNDLASRSDVKITVLNLSRGNSASDWFRNLLVAIRIIWKTYWLGQKHDVISFHANYRGRILFGPIIYLISRLIRRPLVMRVFGGAFDFQYEELSRIHQWLLRKTYFNSEICLFETKRLVEYFTALRIRRAEWFSNYTAVARLDEHLEIRSVCRRIVFLGRVTKTKGIDELFAAAPHLDVGVQIDVYGPLDDGYSLEVFQRGLGRIQYRGILGRREIDERLWEYDALVLPTFHSGEGYPGVILEAYSHGLPVIVTNWLSIPEIVDDTCGILIEPRNTMQLVDAINRLHRDTALYQRLQEGAWRRRLAFSSTYWTQRFVSLCYEVAGRQEPLT